MSTPATPLHRNQKNKTAAALLALFLGWTGAHRFYLGNAALGIVYLCIGLMVCVPMVILGIVGGALTCFGCVLVLPPLIWCFVEFIVLIAMSDAEFAKKYHNPEI